MLYPLLLAGGWMTTIGRHPAEAEPDFAGASSRVVH
jgi:hypothetical protein